MFGATTFGVPTLEATKRVVPSGKESLRLFSEEPYRSDKVA